jgi:hypothetical protein
MRAGHVAASGARHVIGVGLQALLVAAIIATVALAMSAVYKPAGFVAGVGEAQAAKVTASISFANAARTDGAWPANGDRVSFAVDTDVRKSSDLYKLWVANKCYQDGTLEYAEYQPVLDGVSGPFTLSWGDGGATCKAYVFLHPYTQTPLRGASMSYSAGG